ncbi:(2Fe-2S) ferredoxin domain-containing protein [Sphingomonas sp. A2-49]|uniref:(2Fe-2S) ferredoxin domain-containing protein n=1 Tax=Sphingomonas sp. A2-49 TaxID=1391375 RepID=UPI0021D33144|nr:(2Fe-2S) ferredoxin domain-containing protein [Sphingomonas sp. A2-49]MCU6453871.1 (2Fe-2S) ferredoxin domain-containing protein [Sphingomonas sp. A2-49]
MAAALKRVRSDWGATVLVCGKCSKKLDGGFGRKGRSPLAKVLRGILGLKKGRKAAIGIVETRCLGVCPRGGVVLVDGRTPGEWLVVPRDADVAELAARLERGVPAGATARS